MPPSYHFNIIWEIAHDLTNVLISTVESAIISIVENFRFVSLSLILRWVERRTKCCDSSRSWDNNNMPFLDNLITQNTK